MLVYAGVTKEHAEILKTALGGYNWDGDTMWGEKF